jgi:AcrR family transcriptional regulator
VIALERVSPRPEPRDLTPRTAEIVTAARDLLETEGPSGLTMRRLAERLSIRAPSLYKHLPGKGSLESLVVEAGLFESGDALHHAVDRPGRRTPLASLVAAYRRHGQDHPNLYRLITAPDFPRTELVAGLENWAGEPFYRVLGEPYTAQALWAFVHGTMMLELDNRFLDGSDLDRTWAAGVKAFSAVSDT